MENNSQNNVSEPKNETKEARKGTYLEELIKKRLQEGTSTSSHPLLKIDKEDEAGDDGEKDDQRDDGKEEEEKESNLGDPLAENDEEGRGCKKQEDEEPQQQPVAQHLCVPHFHFSPDGIERGDSRSPLDSTRSNSPFSQPSSPFIWRPIMPGYTAEKGNARDMKDIEREERQGADDDARFGWASRGSIFIPVASEVSFKMAIPAMPKCLAFLCSVCNCLVPGLGTFLSGISIGCQLSISRNGPEVPQTHVICVNVRAAFLQLITTPLLLIGWFWSLLWAMAFLIIAEEYEILKSSSTSPSPLTTHATTTISTISTSTTTTATTSYCEATSLGDFISLVEPPIIVLQQAPIIVNPPATPLAIRQEVDDNQSNVSSTSRSRRRTRIRRNGRGLNPILMNPATLEHLVHHSSIVPQPDSSFVELTSGKENL